MPAMGEEGTVEGMVDRVRYDARQETPMTGKNIPGIGGSMSRDGG